jgi:hypothetical protein
LRLSACTFAWLFLVHRRLPLPYALPHGQTSFSG